MLRSIVLKVISFEKWQPTELSLLYLQSERLGRLAVLG
jgi:hypothetical protein